MVRTRISLALFGMFIGCGGERGVEIRQPESTTFAPRVLRDASVDSATYVSATHVVVHLKAGSYEQTLDQPFSNHHCLFSGVPVGVPFTVQFSGLNAYNDTIWSGAAYGTTTRDTASGGVNPSVVVMRAGTPAPTLSGMSVNGRWLAGFTPMDTVYVDTVPSAMVSVSVQATVSGVVTGTSVTCNGMPCGNVPISPAKDPDSIRVVVTGPTQRRRMYLLLLYQVVAAAMRG